MQCGGREATLIHSLLVSTCPRVLHSACCTPTPGAGPSAGRDLEPEPHLFPFLGYSVLNRTQHSSDMWAVAQDRGCVVCVEARPLCGCGPWRLVFVLTKLGPAQPSPVPCHRVQAARLQGGLSFRYLLYLFTPLILSTQSIIYFLGKI